MRIDASCAGLSYGPRAIGEWTQLAGTGSAGREAESRLGRVLDGVADGLDSLRWPAGPGDAQHIWEPSRTITERIPNRASRLRALGNAFVPQILYPIFAPILAAENTDPEAEKALR